MQWKWKCYDAFLVQQFWNTVCAIFGSLFAKWNDAICVRHFGITICTPALWRPQSTLQQRRGKQICNFWLQPDFCLRFVGRGYCILHFHYFSLLALSDLKQNLCLIVCWAVVGLLQKLSESAKGLYHQRRGLKTD